MTLHDRPSYPPAPVRYLTSKDVRSRYGVSEMTLFRWMRREGLGFPRPIKIGRRNYWNEAELVIWEQAAAARRDA